MFKQTTLNRTMSALIAAAGLMAGAATLSTDAAAQNLTDPVEIMKQSHLNLYYAGEDGKSTVEMVLEDKKGKQRSRRFVMFRLDLEEGGTQKYFTYFLEPSDVRRTTFMVWKEADKDDSRWIYVPAIDLVRRISANDKGSSFVGSDFSYEDVSGRHWNDDDHVLTGTEELDGRMTYVIESTPRGKDSFKMKRTWIDVERMLPLREEYYDKKDKLVKTFEALSIEEIDGYMTITSRRMTNVKKNHHTTVTFTDVAYDIGVEDKVFTERYLKSPPSSLIKD